MQAAKAQQRKLARGLAGHEGRAAGGQGAAEPIPEGPGECILSVAGVSIGWAFCS